MKRLLKILVLGQALILSSLFAFPSGTISGIVTDLETDEVLLGATIQIHSLNIGTTTDVDGRFLITNLNPGTYTLTISYIGYKQHSLKDVRVTMNHRTRANIQLEPTELSGEIVEVTAKRPLYQKDVTASAHFISYDEINKLPVHGVEEVTELQPGVVAGHIRGGRKDEVVYLIDGIPVMGTATGKVMIGTEATDEIIVQTGGFNAEYGQAMSGVVDIITKTGYKGDKLLLQLYGNKHSNPNLFDPTERTTLAFDLSKGGQIQNRPFFYFAAFDYKENEFNHKAEEYGERKLVGLDPTGKTWHSLININSDPASSTKFSSQLINSYSNWREYNNKWKLNLPNLPWQRLRSIRFNMRLSKTLSSDLYYNIQFGHLKFIQQVMGKPNADQETVRHESAYNPFLGEYENVYSYVVAGDFPWWMDHLESQYFAKGNLVYHLNHFHKLKFGFDFTQYDLKKRSVFKHQLGDIGTMAVNFIQTIDYEYNPQRFAFYIQDKVEYDGLLANIGLRYDRFDPKALRPALESKQLSEDTRFSEVWIIDNENTVQASVKSQISPRVGVALPLSDESEVRMNYGYFFQTPLFDYLYTNADYTVVQGFAPLGDPDLKPAKTTAFEIGYIQSFDERFLIDVTYFNKDVSNLVDVETYQHKSSWQIESTGLGGNAGLTRYINVAYSLIDGFEAQFEYRPSTRFNASIAYTYLRALGSSDHALNQFEFVYDEYDTPPTHLSEYSLSWDQRHTLVASFYAILPFEINCSGVIKYGSPLPYTQDRGRFTTPNNARMGETSTIDLKLLKALDFADTRLAVYLELLNLTDTENILWMDRDGLVGGYLSDPGAIDQRRRILFGLKYEL